jgi:hypothetical protein
MKSLLIGLVLSLACGAALARPSGLDKNGCHHDNQHGGYHCHR